MRKFFIQYTNSNADASSGKLILDLNGGSHSSGNGGAVITDHQYLDRALFLADPAGLGMSLEADFAYAGGLSHVCTRSEPSQIVIAGILNIKPNGVSGRNVYLNYSTLVPLICNKLITFKYCPYSDYTPEYNYSYNVDGYITKLTKTEKKGGVLPLGFEFRGITPWYKSGFSTPTQSLTAGSTYTFSSPGSYGAAFTFLFKASGSVTNFSATITRGGVEIGALVYSGALASSKTIAWSSDPASRYVRYNGSDALSNVDLTHNIYPLIKQGDVLTIGSEMTGTIAFTGYYKVYYGGA